MNRPTIPMNPVRNRPPSLILAGDHGERYIFWRSPTGVQLIVTADDRVTAHTSWPNGIKCWSECDLMFSGPRKVKLHDWLNGERPLSVVLVEARSLAAGDQVQLVGGATKTTRTVGSAHWVQPFDNSEPIVTLCFQGGDVWAGVESTKWLRYPSVGS